MAMIGEATAGALTEVSPPARACAQGFMVALTTIGTGAGKSGAILRLGDVVGGQRVVNHNARNTNQKGLGAAFGNRANIEQGST